MVPSRVPIRPFVLDFVRDAGHAVTEAGHVHVAGPLTDLVVDEHQGTFTARRAQDGTLGDVRLASGDPRVLETFLATELAPAWRRAHGLRPLDDARLRPARGHDVVGQADGTSAVRRRSDGTVVAWHLTATDARRLAAALDHPVESVVAAAKEPRGRPVWTGSALAPLVWSLAAMVVTLGAVGAILLPRHAGSWEMVVGGTLGLLISVVGAAWLVLRMRGARRRTDDALDRARPGAPRWRCTTGPGFPATVTRGLPERVGVRPVEVTLVETAEALEVWRDGGAEPLVHLPWDQVASVDCEPVPSSPVSVLVVRDVHGGRVPVILLRDRTGGQRGATVQVTEQYAAHLRDRCRVQR